MKKIEIFDSTLRDGAQGEHINFSPRDKMNILKALDDFGVDYVEAGNPASNPKDMEFFKMARSWPLKHAKLTAFGSTRRKDTTVSDDQNVQTLAAVDVDAVTLFGKSWDMQVTEIIRTTTEENIAMIRDTVEYFAALKREVIFDAEHFFDGYKANPEYALQTIKAAAEAGASRIVLCDTNGGCFPEEIYEMTKTAAKAVSVPVGVHCHNDTGCAVSNSLAAVRAGAMQVQGTFIGIGERCGNANLSTIIPDLQLKLGYKCGQIEDMHMLTKTARRIAEISNVILPDSRPYVGRSAFAHKGGMHIDGVQKNSRSFEHIDPESVGNKRNFLLSEVSGRTLVLSKLKEIAPGLNKDSPEIADIMTELKELEYQGYQYEAAEPSFELLVKKRLGLLKDFFRIEFFKIIGERSEDFPNPSCAVVKVQVGDKTEISASEGDGPVNAIDKALRHALRIFYPVLDDVHLIDYKVRVMDSAAATASIVRVLIESTDGENVWTTVGASTDIINASVKALMDSIEYKLMKDMG